MQTEMSRAERREVHKTQVAKMLAAGKTVAECADELKCSKGRIYALSPGGARVASGKPAYKERSADAPKAAKKSAKKAAKPKAAKKPAKKAAKPKAAKKTKPKAA